MSSALTRSVAILIGYLGLAVVLGCFIAAWLLQSVIKPARDILAVRTGENEETVAGVSAPGRSRARPD